MKKIGILRGMETTFPDGLVAHINETYGDRGVHAEFVQIGGVVDTGDPGYAVILDRISHEVPFYRSYLKWAALKGTYVVNNPFWWSADDKFIDNVIAERAGVAVPRTVILPHKDSPPNTTSASFRNLEYPLDWDGVFAYIGFPAFLKPHDGGGWRGVTKVNTPEELFAAYDASGTDCMMLQENIDFEEYYRCYGIGQSEVFVMRYNPVVDMHERYSAVPGGPIEPARLAKLERDVLAICRALGYDMNTVEFAVRDGVPYAIDFMNPAPDAEYNSVGHTNYEWVIRTVGKFLVEKALDDRPAMQFTANGALEPNRGASLLDAAQGAAASAAAAAQVQVTKAAAAVKKAAAGPRAMTARKAAATLADRAEELADQVEDRLEDLADTVEDRVEAAVDAVKRAVTGKPKKAPKSDKGSLFTGAAGTTAAPAPAKTAGRTPKDADGRGTGAKGTGAKGKAGK